MDITMNKINKGVDMSINWYEINEHSTGFAVEASNKYQHEFEGTKDDDTYDICSWTCKKDGKVIIDITNESLVKDIKEFKTKVLEKKVDKKIFETDSQALNEVMIIFEEILNLKLPKYTLTECFHSDKDRVKEFADIRDAKEHVYKFVGSSEFAGAKIESEDGDLLCKITSEGDLVCKNEKIMKELSSPFQNCYVGELRDK